MQRLTVFTDDMIMGCFFKLLEREKKVVHQLISVLECPDL